MTDFRLPASYYEPPDPVLIECPDCKGTGGECERCDGDGEFNPLDDPDWCERCGLTGNCPECDPPDPREREE